MRAALVVHAKKPNVKEITQNLISFLKEIGASASLTEDDAIALGLGELAQPPDKLTEGADLIISLGGDGTMLRAIRQIGPGEIPVLGVNLGKLGFMTEIVAAQLLPGLKRYLAGDFEIDKRMMLKVKAGSGKETLLEQHVLNEVVIGRGAQHRLVELSTFINGTHFTDYAADSIIFSTPTGSTAYSLSAGGPIISPQVEAILMTPVCPHSFFNRSVMLAGQDRIRIELVKGRKDFSLTLDGITADLIELDFIEVERSAKLVNLVRFGQKDFYLSVKENLNNWTRIGDG